MKKDSLNTEIEEKKEKETEDPDKNQEARHEAHEARRTFIAGVPSCADLTRVAVELCVRWPDYPEDPFVDSKGRRRRKARKAFDNGEGWAARLFLSLENPYFYTLHTHHLGLPPELGEVDCLYDHKSVKRWLTALKTQIKPPFRWKLEFAERVHVHVIAERDAGPPQIRRDGQVIKPAKDYDGLIEYLSKPSAPWTPKPVAAWMRAKRRGGRLPRTSGTVGLPNKKTFHKKALEKTSEEDE